MEETTHFSTACPALRGAPRISLSWQRVTCRVCNALYASWVWRRIARLVLDEEERKMVIESDARYERQLVAMGRRRVPRWLLALLPVLGCLACPAHIALILGFVGAGVHVGTHDHENWIGIVIGVLAIPVVLLFERYHHRRHCRHGHAPHRH